MSRQCSRQPPHPRILKCGHSLCVQTRGAVQWYAEQRIAHAARMRGDDLAGLKGGRKEEGNGD